MNKTNKTAKAFTLAETLVTLMIIGVVAAITIPTLKKTATEQEFVSGALKAYSAVTGATSEIKTKNGPVALWVGSAAETMKLYQTELNCTGSIPNSYPIKYLSGNSYNNGNMFNSSTACLTADGALYYIQSTDPTCKMNTNLISHGCIDIGVDVNGPKLPNTIGVDIFGFFVSKSDTLPEGSGPNSEYCVTGATGWSCSSQIIKEKKISW